MDPMKVAEARARFGELLDEAEKGDPVIIERRGVRFRVVVDSPRKPTAIPAFEFVDPGILEGEWSWEPRAKGLALRTRKRR